MPDDRQRPESESAGDRPTEVDSDTGGSTNLQRDQLSRNEVDRRDEQRRPNDLQEQQGPPPREGPRTVESRPVDSAAGEQEVGGVTIFDGENLHHEIHPSWAAYSRDITIAALLTATIMGTFIAPYWLYKAHKKRKNTQYIITSGRIIMQEGGATSTSSEEFQFQNIDTISTSRSMIEGFVDKGTVELTLRENYRDDKEIELNGIREYDDVKTTIRREQYNETQGQQDRGRRQGRR